MRLPIATHYRRGLGLCTSIPGSKFCFDPATGNEVNCTDAVCATPGAGAGPSNTPTYIAPSYTGSPSENVPFGLSVSTIPTLDAYMQNWLSAISAVSPASLGITQASDLMASAASQVQSYCSEAGSPADCANAGAVAQRYGQMAVAAFSRVPSSQFDPGTYTPYAYMPPVTQPNAIIPPARTVVPTTQVTNNPLAPPTGNPVADKTNVVNNSLNTGNSTQGGGPVPTPAPFDLGAFMHQYGGLIALGIGAVVLLPMLTKGK